jgi:alkylation response protein AidB-like acyl-CoA dehydrogenase
LAFAVASETAELATYHAIHFHGGYGFMIEHDVQLHYRRARGWARVWGSADDAYRRAATARYGTAHLRSA